MIGGCRRGDKVSETAAEGHYGLYFTTTFAKAQNIENIEFERFVLILVNQNEFFFLQNSNYAKVGLTSLPLCGYMQREINVGAAQQRVEFTRLRISTQVS